MKSYLIKAKFKSEHAGKICHMNIPVTATDSAAAKAAVIDFIMNDIDHPRKASDIKMQVMVKVLPNELL